jgi:hypothetical protein
MTILENTQLVKHLKTHGKSKNEPDSKYDSKEIEMGKEVEKEHTPDVKATKEIAKDHLKEIPDYYTRLDKMEKGAKSEKCLKKRLASFFMDNPNPQDDLVHKFAEKHGMKPDVVETAIYSMLTDLLNKEKD